MRRPLQYIWHTCTYPIHSICVCTYHYAAAAAAKSLQSCLILCDPIDGSITADGYHSHKMKRSLLLGRKIMTNLDSTLKSRDITLPTKVHLVKAMVFPVVMYGYESWTIKEAEHHRTDAFELWCWRRLLDCKIQPIHPKGDKSWVFIGRTDAEAPILWPPDAKSWLIWKDPHARQEWGQEEKEMTEDEMVGWHQQLDKPGFEQTLGDGGGEGSLECCRPWAGRVRPDWATELNRGISLFFFHKSTYW